MDLHEKSHFKHSNILNAREINHERHNPFEKWNGWAYYVVGLLMDVLHRLK